MAADYQKLVYSKATTTPYTDMYNAYKKGREAQKKTDIANYNTRRDADLAKSNAQYDATGRQNYINYMQAMRDAPSQLNAMGIRGGASESSMLRLGTNYNSNVAANNQARDSAANDIRSNYAQMIYDYNKAYNEDLNAKQAAYAEKQRDWEQSQLEKNLQYFSSAIKGQYDTKEGYLNLIKELQNSNDPNRVAKIMLTRQAMNEWLKEQEEENASSGGGGGGGGYSRSYGGYSGGYSGGSSGGGGSSSSNAQALNDKYRNRAAQGRNPSGQTRGSGSGSSGRKSVSSSYYTGSYRTSTKKSSGNNWWNRLFGR